MIRTFTVPASPVDPADGVTQRLFYIFDRNGNGTVATLDPSVVSIDAEIDDSLTPGKCVLVDVNDSGPSADSPSVALVPPNPNPPPPPPPVPSTIPATPKLGEVTWTN